MGLCVLLRVVKIMHGPQRRWASRFLLLTRHHTPVDPREDWTEHVSKVDYWALAFLRSIQP